MASLIKIKIAFVHPNTGNGLPRQGRNSIKFILPVVTEGTRLAHSVVEIVQEVGRRRRGVKSYNLLHQ